MHQRKVSIMFGQKKHDNEEQLKKLEATIQDYQEKLAKAEETIKQKEKALEHIKRQQLSPEEIAEKRLAKKREKSKNRAVEQGKRDINVFALVDAQLDAHKKKEHTWGFPPLDVGLQFRPRIAAARRLLRLLYRKTTIRARRGNTLCQISGKSSRRYGRSAKEMHGKTIKAAGRAIFLLTLHNEMGYNS